MVYIYTSGTTGLPKPAYFDHFRLLTGAVIAGDHLDIGADDRVYTSLPLYHASGQCSAVGFAVVTGCTVVIRSRFSAGQFWSDCEKYGANVAQYIGEMCRFLLGKR